MFVGIGGMIDLVKIWKGFKGGDFILLNEDYGLDQNEYENLICNMQCMFGFATEDNLPLEVINFTKDGVYITEDLCIVEADMSEVNVTRFLQMEEAFLMCDMKRILIEERENIERELSRGDIGEDTPLSLFEAVYL